MSKRSAKIRTLAVVAVGALIVSSCSSDDDNSSTTAAADTNATNGDSAAPNTAVPETEASTANTDVAEVEDTAAPEIEPGEPYAGEVGVTDDTIKIGYFLPETGALSALSTDLAKAINAVGFDEINAAGGVHGRQLEMVLYDDGSGNPAVTQASFKDAEDEVFAMMSIIGNTATTMAALAEEAEVPTVVSNIDGRVGRDSMWTFAAVPYWDTSSRLMDDYILSIADADTPVGVVFMATPNGEGARDAFLEEADAAGLNVIVEQPVEPVPATCSNEIARLADAGVEIVYLISGALPGICMHRAAGDAGYSPEAWLSPANGWNIGFVARAVGGLAESSTSFGHAPTLETEAGQHYVEQVNKFVPDAQEGDITVDGFLTYSPERLLIEGLQAAGPQLTREGFFDAMETSVSGVETGYGPPPIYGPGERSGPLSANLWVPGTRLVDGVDTPTWVTADATWHDEF